MASGSFMRALQDSLSNEACDSGGSDTCRDDSAALPLKLAAFAAILVASTIGIAIPLLAGRRKSLLATDGNLFITAKSVAAGVILATGFVHLLPDATETLTHPCLPDYPWDKFPFSGFFAMMAALMTLLVDFLATQFYENKSKTSNENRNENENEETLLVAEVNNEDEEHGHGHGHSHIIGGDSAARNVVVAQVLELGIVSHSVLIGLSLGVSHSPCTIKPLIAALSFHQFFEGFALGGCIAQAGFSKVSSLIMACFFALTTPGGILVGIAVASSYNPESVLALVTEGTLDSISAGILIYMALVDLIAADFLGKKMRSNTRLQLLSFIGLFTGAGLMGALAIWA